MLIQFRFKAVYHYQECINESNRLKTLNNELDVLRIAANRVTEAWCVYNYDVLVVTISKQISDNPLTVKRLGFRGPSYLELIFYPCESVCSS